MLVNYSSDSQQTEPNKKTGATGLTQIPTPNFSLAKKISLNPEVDTSKLESKKLQNIINSFNRVNGIVDKGDSLSGLYRPNHLTGHVTAYNTSNYSFNEQFHNFQNYGVGYDPSVSDINQQRLVVDKQRYPLAFNLIDQGDDLPSNAVLKVSTSGTLLIQEKLKSRQLKYRREKFGDITEDINSYRGPWAGYQGEKNVKQPEELTEAQKLLLKERDQKQKQVEENKEKEREEFKASADFHIQREKDYKGRSFIEPTIETKSKSHDQKCYIPKQTIHIYAGHTKGVHCVKFFPQYGQYILSGGLDSLVKLWDVNNGFDRKCVVTFKGHTSAIRDLEFTQNGDHFLSSAYDKTINYWDTETGKAVKTFRIQTYPYCARFHPDLDKQHSFLLGSSNKKIAQYDIRSGSRTQVYDEHLGAVNTVTFIDQHKQFVSTSDDQKIFLWQFGIPVVVKHVSEPEMHAVSYASMHPSMKFWCGQSSDNKLTVYDTKGGNFRINRKQKFTGHQCSGYSIGVSYSPDGQFVCSGDSEGRAYFWDWKSGGNYRILQAHDNICMGIDWHPLEPSKVVTCGYDNLIKLWD